VGASMGFLSTMMDSGQTLGPIISGIILASFGQQYIPLFVSLSFILLLSNLIFIFKTDKRRKKENLLYRESVNPKYSDKACLFTQASELETWINQ